MEPITIAIVVVGAVAYFISRTSGDQKNLDLFLGALHARRSLQEAQGNLKEAEATGRMEQAVRRARACVSQRPPARVHEEEQQYLYQASDPYFLENLLRGFGSYLAVKESIHRLSQKAEKTRKS